MTLDASKPAPKTETKKPAMKLVGKKAKGEVNKSAEIRRVAGAMKAKGEKPRPVVIIDTLKKQGIIVSSPQVSMVLKKLGFRPRKRRKSGEIAPKATTGTATKKTTKIRVEDLVKAQKVAASMGGIDKALSALKALKDFEG